MSWHSVQLDNVLDLADPGVWGPEDQDGGISVLRSTNFRDDGRLDLSNLALRDIPAKKRTTKLLQPGDVILERSGGGPNKPVGRVCYFEGDHQPHVFGNFCQRFRANPALCDSRFLFWVLFAFHAAGKTFAFQKQTTGIRNLEYKQYLAHLVGLPALSEQRRIAEILDRADALRLQRQAADEKSDRVVAALFFKMFGDPARNPFGWPSEPLSDDVVDFRYGTSERCEANYNGLPVLRIPNIVRGTLDLTDLKYTELPEKEVERLRLKRGDVLFVRTNGNRDYVGRCSVFDLDEPFLFASYLIRGRFDQSLFLPEYVTTCLSLRAGRMMLSKGIRTTAGQSNLSVKGLRELVLPRPPIELQQEFQKRLRSIDQLKQRMQSRGDRIERLFAVLLNRAFSEELTAGWREQNKATLDFELAEQLRLLETAKQKGKTPTRAANGNAVRHAGHDMYNKAALTAYIVHRCHDARQPMGRTKVAKLFYLAHRKAELTLTEQFTRRAAGPLDDACHKFLNLARKNRWVKLPKAQGKLKPVVPGDAIDDGAQVAKQKFAEQMGAINELLDVLVGKPWQELECWATVDEAAQNVLGNETDLSLAAVKAVIAADPAWRPKLERVAFSDANIQAALRGLRSLGLVPEQARTR